jgi:hypothetical protein
MPLPPVPRRGRSPTRNQADAVGSGRSRRGRVHRWCRRRSRSSRHRRRRRRGRHRRSCGCGTARGRRRRCRCRRWRGSRGRHRSGRDDADRRRGRRDGRWRRGCCGRRTVGCCRRRRGRGRAGAGARPASAKNAVADQGRFADRSRSSVRRTHQRRLRNDSGSDDRKHRDGGRTGRRDVSPASRGTDAHVGRWRRSADVHREKCINRGSSAEAALAPRGMQRNVPAQLIPPPIVDPALELIMERRHASARRATARTRATIGPVDCPC